LELHSCPKPIPLIQDVIESYSEKKQIILDVFCGSGTTLIVCEKTNRICYGMEIDPYYCDIIIDRYKNWCEKNNQEYTIKRNGKECS